jgi:hypothetical protein
MEGTLHLLADSDDLEKTMACLDTKACVKLRMRVLAGDS